MYRSVQPGRLRHAAIALMSVCIGANGKQGLSVPMVENTSMLFLGSMCAGRTLSRVDTPLFKPVESSTCAFAARENTRAYY